MKYLLCEYFHSDFRNTYIISCEGGTEPRHGAQKVKTQQFSPVLCHWLVDTTGNWDSRYVWCSDNTNEAIQPFHNTKYQTDEPEKRNKKLAITGNKS